VGDKRALSVFIGDGSQTPVALPQGYYFEIGRPDKLHVVKDLDTNN
jgi:hypothetical protein